MTATAIIIGTDPNTRRSDLLPNTPLQSTLPSSAVTVSSCPRCPAAVQALFNTGAGAWSFPASAAAPQPTAEMYVLRFSTQASAEGWVSNPTQMPWLSAPDKRIYIIDDDLSP